MSLLQKIDMQTPLVIQLYLLANKKARFCDIATYCEQEHGKTPKEIASAFTLLLRNDNIESTSKMKYKLTGK